MMDHEVKLFEEISNVESLGLKATTADGSASSCILLILLPRRTNRSRLGSLLRGLRLPKDVKSLYSSRKCCIVEESGHVAVRNWLDDMDKEFKDGKRSVKDAT